MAATTLELFEQEEIDLIFEALEHRKRYYANKIPQQQVNAACGTVQATNTVERYLFKAGMYDQLLSKWAEETT